MSHLLPLRQNISPACIRPMLRMVAFILLSMNTLAQAAVYKCEANNGQISYTDQPCAQTLKQDTLNLPKLKTPEHQQSQLYQQLAASVKQAIRDGDLIRAEALASTEEQKIWVAEARREQAKKTKTETASNKFSSSDCQRAQKKLDQGVRENRLDSQGLQALNSLMRVQCGLPDQPTTYGHSYRGFYASPFYRGHGGYQPPQIEPGYTSPPYNRHLEPNFGSRFIRP